MPSIKKSKRRPWQSERKAFERKLKKKDNYKFYNSSRWRKHRKLFMSLPENQLCVRCKKLGFVVEAKVVDHITPINQGGDKFDYDNLQPLCHRCHNSKSGKEAHI